MILFQIHMYELFNQKAKIFYVGTILQNKKIKESKIKVSSAVQGEMVRVTGKKRDDLQEAMQVVRSAELGQPFQFKNFRD